MDVADACDSQGPHAESNFARRVLAERSQRGDHLAGGAGEDRMRGAAVDRQRSGESVGRDDGIRGRRKLVDQTRARAHGRRQRNDQQSKKEESHQKVDPTANLNVNFCAGRRLLSSTPKRCGLYAKIKRNGTFNTGMKKRISAPVDVLNAVVWPITRWNFGGALGSTSRVVEFWKSTIGGRPGSTVSLTSSFQAKPWPMSRTWPVS